MLRAGSLSDGDLVNRCLDGDDEAWAVFVERFSSFVYAILMRGFRLSTHEAEDVFQEVFIRAFDRLDTVRDADAVKSWLAQITRRLAVDRIRSGGREVVVEELPEQTDDGFYARLDEAMDVREALEAMGGNCRDILDRFFIRDQTYRTIGEELEIPPGTIASRISRCLSNLKDRLEEPETDLAEEGR